MEKHVRDNLQRAIKDYNATQPEAENRVNMQDILSEIGSIDNEEVEKATEILKSKTENGE